MSQMTLDYCISQQTLHPFRLPAYAHLHWSSHWGKQALLQLSNLRIYTGRLSALQGTDSFQNMGFCGCPPQDSERRGAMLFFDKCIKMHSFNFLWRKYIINKTPIIWHFWSPGGSESSGMWFGLSGSAILPLIPGSSIPVTVVTGSLLAFTAKPFGLSLRGFYSLSWWHDSWARHDG